MSEALLNVRAALALRDAVMEASEWAGVERALAKWNLSLEEIARRLKPRIGFDPHNHTLHSDGIFSYRQLAWWCKAVGLPAIGITDHDNITPGIGDAIEEAEALGVRIVPGLEFTVNRLGGQAWRGLEIGVHFFPARRFAEFARSPEAAGFFKRFEQTNLLKSQQAWQALDIINEKFIRPRGLRVIERDELWEASGSTDPICVSVFTVLLLSRFFQEKRDDLLAEFPDTRVIHTYLGKNGFYPPIQAPAQTLDDLIDIKKTLAENGIRSTITLNHPEEWLSKCGLKRDDGSPDTEGIRRLIALLCLHEPRVAPVSFVELYTSRNTAASRAYFTALFDECERLRASLSPSLPPLHPLASTDSHRISGFLDENGEVQGWVPGEDFVFGMGMIDHDHPTGNLEVPRDYPSAEEILELMERCAR